MSKPKRIGIGILLFITSALALAQQPVPQHTVEKTVVLNLASQPLEDALHEFSRATGLKVMLYTVLGRGIISPRVSGTLTPAAALDLLLKGAALRFEYLDAQTIAVLPARDESPDAISRPMSRVESDRIRTASATESAGVTDTSTASYGEDNQSSSTDHESDDKPNGNHQYELEEVIVTAQKRSEKLIDVPASISAISSERLDSLQVNSLVDLANYVPGMSVNAQGAPGARTVILRGVNSSYENDSAGATVATYIDDLPIGSSTGSVRGAQYGVDLQPYDIDRVEVLKGPQGTLYGANTLAGLVKYVLREPDLTRFEVRAGTELSYTDDAGGANWGVRAAVNLPIVTDKLGVRVSGFKKRNAGYIDNIGIGVNAANSSTQQGGRATALWQPTDNFSIKASVLGEDANTSNVTAITMNGATNTPLYGPLVISTQFPEPFHQTTRNYSLSIDWHLPFATLTSATGWSTINWNRAEDYSVPYGAFCLPGLLGPTNPGCPDYPFPNALALYNYGGDDSKFVEEVRLTSPEDQRIQWMLGGYYTREYGGENFDFPTFTPAHVQLPVRDNLLLGNYAGIATYKESAGFANLTYKFTEHFDVSGGIRRSSYTQSTGNAENQGVLYGGNGVVVISPDTSLPSVGVTNWMGDVRFHPSQDAMLYARVATGYRPGSGCKFYSNGTPCGIPSLGIPGSVNPDRTTNYETGLKSQFFDKRVQLNVSVFYIKWKDIQVTTLTAQGLAYPSNGNTASSRGVELETGYQVTRGLRINTTLAYTDAHLDEDAPGILGGNAGDRLPVSPLWTGSLAVDYTRPLAGDRLSLNLGGGYRYRDGIVNLLEGTGKPTPMGPQNIVNLYAGFELKNLTTRFYASNIFNNQSYAGLQFINDSQKPRFVPIQPRTIGVSVDYKF